LEKPELSRITDVEMKKLMIQSSVALAKLLAMKESDPEQYWRDLTKFHKDYCWKWEK